MGNKLIHERMIKMLNNRQQSSMEEQLVGEKEDQQLEGNHTLKVNLLHMIESRNLLVPAS